MKKALIGGAVLAVLVFTGCGAKGAPFAGFTQPKENRGMIYIYRPTAFIGGGVYYDIHVTTPTMGDFVVGELLNGGYIGVDVPTGQNEIWGETEAKASVTLTVQNGDTHCIRGGIGMGILVGRPRLEVVDLETCKAEIVNTQEPR